MKLDRLIQVLLPHDEKFYQFFEESARNLVSASKLLEQLPTASPAQRVSIVEQIHELEHQGDAVTHKIFAELNATFVTPFDREDIHVLASALDDVLDYVDGSAARFVLYKLQDCPDDMTRLIHVIRDAVAEIQRGVSLLRDFRKSSQLQMVLEKINEYENAADAIFERAVADLFEFEKDPIKVIKLKEIYVGLETATDKCEDAANVMESLLIKHG